MTIFIKKNIMIKKYKFAVNEEEKSRILSLHENRTKSQYLTITESTDTEVDEQYDFAGATDTTPKPPVTGPTPFVQRDETADTPYTQKTSVQSLSPEEVTKLLSQKKVEEPKKTDTTQITFPKNDPTGINAVKEKMKSLKLDTTNMALTLKTVINDLQNLGYKI